MKSAKYILFMMLVAGCRLAPELGEDPSVWEYELPGNEGFNEPFLLELNANILNGEFEGTTSMTIIRNDKLVFENYFAGGSRDTKFDVGRCSLSWIVAVFGRVIIDELNGDIDVPIFTILNQYSDIFDNDAEKREITVRHLLEMRSGIAWNELITLPFANESDVRKAQAEVDPARFILEKPLEATPGLRYNFKSASGVIILKIIEELTNQPVEDYFNKVLFSKIDVEPEYETLLDGSPNMVWGTKLTLLEFSKVNYLLFKRGDWFGEQILPEEWIETSMEPSLTVSTSNFAGYHWRIFTPERIPGYDDLVYQFGDMSQAVYMSQSGDFIINITSDNPTTSFANFSYVVFLNVLFAMNGNGL